MRKKAETLEQARNEIKREYKRGPRSEGRKVTNPDTWSEVERAVARESACFFKAAGFSHNYIGDALNLTRGQIGHWFEEPAMQERYRAISADMKNGAIKLLKSYAIEIVESLMTIARTTDDEKLAASVLQDLADRIGLTKVSRTESATTATQKSEVEITDPAGLVEKLKDAPPEVQQQAAQHMEGMMALMAEHIDTADVTHAA
jgi:hypothetical protein